MRFVLVEGARSAEPPINQGTFLAIAFSTSPMSFARGDALGVGGKGRQVLVPAVGKLAVLHAVEFVGEAGILCLVLASNSVEPGVAQLLAAAADALLEMLVDAVRDEELGVLGPAVDLLGQLDLIFAERLAVSGMGVLLVRRALADVAVDDDQRGTIVGLRNDRMRPIEQRQIVGVAHPRDVPAIGL